MLRRAASYRAKIMMAFDTYTPDTKPKCTDAGFYLRKYGVGSPSYLATLAVRGNGPKFESLRTHTNYRVGDLDEWAQGISATPRKSPKK